MSLPEMKLICGSLVALGGMIEVVHGWLARKNEARSLAISTRGYVMMMFGLMVAHP